MRLSHALAFHMPKPASATSLAIGMLTRGPKQFLIKSLMKKTKTGENHTLELLDRVLKNENLV